MPLRTRRGLLAVGAGLLGSVAGCLYRERSETTDQQPTTTTPSGAQTEAAHRSFDHAGRLHRIAAGFPQRDVASYYLAVLTSDDHAAAFPTNRFETEQAASFVTDTAFSESALVVVQDRRSSSHPDLELVDWRRDGTAVTISARYPGSERTTDVTTDTLLVRIPTDEHPVRAASATIQPQAGDPDRISTLNRYDVVPTFDPAGALVFRNRDCSPVSLWVTVTYSGDLFFRNNVTVEPASIRHSENVVTYPGEWTVAVRAGGTTTTRSWSLTDDSPGAILIDVAGNGTVSLSQHATSVTDPDFDTCESTEYPYESSNPAENLDYPVDLWIVDQSDSEHTVTVTIRHHDAAVFSDEFDTSTGHDKVRRSGLLAKKTTYTVEVTMDDGTAVTESVSVEAGVKKLEVRVTEAGELRVSIR